MELLGSVDVEQHSSEHEFDFDAEREKFLVKQRLWWLDTELQRCVETIML